MCDVPFYRTVMGHRFFDGTLPRLVREIGRLAAAAERLAKALEEDGGRAAKADEKAPAPEPKR